MSKILIGKYEATIYPEGNGYTGAIEPRPRRLAATARASSARAGPRRSSRTS